jgi:hypothetical protein
MAVGSPTLHEPELSGKQPEALGTLEDKDQQLKKLVMKSVTGRVSDARTGFGRFKDAVGLPGLRSHHHRHSKEGVDLESDLSYQPTIDSEVEPPAAKISFDSGQILNHQLAMGQEVHHVPPRGSSEQLSPETLQYPGTIAPRRNSDRKESPRSSLPELALPIQSEERPSNRIDVENLDLDLTKTRSNHIHSHSDHLNGPAAKGLRRPQSYPTLLAEVCARHKPQRYQRRLLQKLFVEKIC